MPKKTVSIPTADGVAPAALFTPADATGGDLPGIVVYMDIWAPRPALDDVCQAIADGGYMVLLPDLFYRQGPYGPFHATEGNAKGDREHVQRMRDATSPELTIADTAAFLDGLAAEGAREPFGVVGYCMGGARALNAAIVYPERVAAAASIHGGNLASEAPNSPHHRAAEIKARVYVGMAGVDNSFPPEQSARLDTALRTAGVDYIIENYVGADHGWAMNDHPKHNAEASARQVRRLHTLFAETL